MKVRGFDENTMRKIFTYFINDDSCFLPGKHNGFRTRGLSHTNKGNNADLSVNEMLEEEKRFKRDMALLYLKTFYGKKTKDFKTDEYKEECVRLHNYIDTYRNPDWLRQCIEECLEKDDGEFFLEKLLPEMFYDGFDKIGLSTNNVDAKVFVTPSFTPEVRIYVNPASSDYRELLVYLYEHAAQEELDIVTKTRMDCAGDESLDNLIIYTSNKDFGRVVELLNEYGKTHPDKVALYGGTMEALGRGEQDWFGFGYEPQSDPSSKYGNSTFNHEIDYIFNTYILPAVVLDDFDELCGGFSEESISHIFLGVCKDEKKAREVAKAMMDSKLREKFLRDFCDLADIKREADGFTSDNAKLTNKERKGYSPEAMRTSKQKSDVTRLKAEKISLVLPSGEAVYFSRSDISKIFQSPILRAAMKDYYSNPEKLEREVSQMMWLWSYLGKSLPFLDEKHPFMSVDMAKALDITEKSAPEKGKGFNAFLERQTIKKALEQKRKRQKEIVDTLCSGSFKLKSKIIEVMQEKGVKYSKDKYENLSLEQLEELYIRAVGIDEVVEASLYIKSEENSRTKRNHKYENTLAGIRAKRGKELNEKIKALKTDEEKKAFAASLSKYEILDVLSAQKLESAATLIDDIIEFKI